nr:hypothetical protein [uncultured Mucilaginibacter sp.]
MKRIKINTTFEEDEEERRQFFVELSYSERLRYHFKLRKMFNFHKSEQSTGRIFIIHKYIKLEDGTWRWDDDIQFDELRKRKL